MDYKLRVVVRVDIDRTHASILVSGCLTRHTQHALVPIIAKVQALLPGCPLTVDLDSAEYIDPAALNQVQQAIARINSDAQSDQHHGLVSLTAAVLRPIASNTADSCVDELELTG